MKAITFIAIGTGIYLGGKYLFTLKRAENKIVLVVSGQIDTITLQGVSVLVKYNIKNPTSANMRMTPPLIRVLIEGKQIATSNMQLVDIPEAYRDSSGKILIKASQETGDISTHLMIPWISLAGLSPDIYKRFTEKDPKNKIDVKIETLAQVFTLVGQFPYEMTSIIKL